MDRSRKENGRGFPTIAGILLGLGLGGFFDGIVMLQVLQWSHMFTSAYGGLDSVKRPKLTLPLSKGNKSGQQAFIRNGMQPITFLSLFRL